MPEITSFPNLLKRLQGNNPQAASGTAAPVALPTSSIALLGEVPKAIKDWAMAKDSLHLSDIVKSEPAKAPEPAKTPEPPKEAPKEAPKVEKKEEPKPAPQPITKPAVKSMPSPNYGSRPGGPKDIDTIVLHHTAGGSSAENIGGYFQNPASEVSAHYTIGKDGTIVQSVEDGNRAWHAGESSFKGRGDVNDFSLGIEIVNEGDGSDPYTDKQYNALIDLVTWMCKTYDIPLDRITGHKDIALPKGRKTDPSSNFDWDRVRDGVQKRLNGQPASVAPKANPAPAQSSGNTYSVKKGDSLWKIAKTVLGDGNRWREIYNLNQNIIKDPNRIYPGQTLKLP